MPRIRTKPVNQFIAGLMQQNGLTRLIDLPAKYPGLDQRMVYNYADVDKDHQGYLSLLRDARALGLTVDEFIQKLLGIDADTASDTQRAS